MVKKVDIFIKILDKQAIKIKNILRKRYAKYLSQYLCQTHFKDKLVLYLEIFYKKIGFINKFLILGRN